MSGAGPWLAGVLDVLSVLLLLNGVWFVLGSSVGLVRLPDLFTRAHAASKCDTVGATSILIALALQAPLAAAAKLLVLVVLLVVTGPTTAHALVRSARRVGVRPWSEGEPR